MINKMFEIHGIHLYLNKKRPIFTNKYINFYFSQNFEIEI